MAAANSALTLRMDHSFFYHGLREFFQVLPHRLGGLGLHQSQFHRLGRQQAKSPAVVALRRRPAGQAGQVGLHLLVSLTAGSG